MAIQPGALFGLVVVASLLGACSVEEEAVGNACAPANGGNAATGGNATGPGGVPGPSGSLPGTPPGSPAPVGPVPTSPPPGNQPPATPTLNSVDTIVDDMTKAPNAYGRNNNEASVIFSGNYEQAKKLAPNYAPSFDSIASWCWAFQSPGNPATNTAIEVRRHEVYVLRSSTNQWEPFDSGRPSGFRGNEGGSTGQLSDEVVVDAETVRVRPGATPRTDLTSYELWHPKAATRTDIIPDVKAVFAKCEMRLVRVDQSQPEDIDTAKYAGQVGFDFWRRQPGYFQPGETQFWGPNGRMKTITRDWQAFNVISMKPGNPSWSNLPGELGFGPAWTVANPYLDPPYTLSEQELRANPPPVK